MMNYIRENVGAYRALIDLGLRRHIYEIPITKEEEQEASGFRTP